MKTIVMTLGLYLIFLSTAFAAEKFTCADGNFSVMMTFEGKKLADLTVYNLPLKKTAKKIIVKRSQMDTARFGFYRVNLIDHVNVSESYLTIMFDAKSSVSESIIGSKYAIDGTPYSKFRLDLTFEAAMEDIGSSYFMKCKKN